jgi:hypothetical protein
MSEKSDVDAQIINDLALKFAAFSVQISSNNRLITNQIARTTERILGGFEVIYGWMREMELREVCTS